MISISRNPITGVNRCWFLGQVGGHEGVGQVVELGAGVTHPEIGKRVGIKWLSNVCGSCGK